MNYPIWEISTIGGPTFIALIAIIHVYIAHLAVGGGLFIWLTDRKSVKENDDQIKNYVKKHTSFFLLLTMVFGGVTGVGIWFIIALVNPAATSTLIHNFVFGWAIEWVFFVGEIVALLIYYYKFDTLTKKARLQLAFFYFLFAWLSLFVINGILSFMLTPGGWLENQSFWNGFFNPTFLPSLFFRTAMAAMIAGIFGYITVVFLKESDFRTKMMKYCSKWILYPVIGFVVFTFWYYYSVPETFRLTNFQLNNQSANVINVFIISSVLLVLGSVFFMLKSSRTVQKVLIAVVVLVGLSWIGGFEYLREIARKPYIISEFMYSNSIKTADEAKYNKEGILSVAKWTPLNEITEDNKMEAGRELFNLQCLSCHTVDGIRNDIKERTADFTYMGMLSHLTGQGKVQTYMPKFIGTGQEMEVLAEYIISEINQKDIVKEQPSHIPQKAEADPAEFDKDKSEYVLFVWNDLGMHCISDSDPWFVFLPPANTLEAQLIKRGELPQIITEGVELRYKVEDGFENPAKYSRFWEFSESLVGKKIENNVGITGNGMEGTFDINEETLSFIAKMIPSSPYKTDGSYNPYPMFTIQAVDSASGEILIETKAVTPTSTEVGCINCHGGNWRVNNTSGFGDETAVNILKAHDRLSGTNLYEEALNGKPKMCQSCHSDPAVGMEGKPGINSLSASMHGWHANYMFAEGGDACIMCHPAYQNGNTKCNRGVHAQLDINCSRCHGNIADHAAALLKKEQDNPSAQRMLANLNITFAESLEEVNPRTPWLNEPDCLTCHDFFEKPAEDVHSYNVWTESGADLYRNRTDMAGVRCAACHSSTHASYPAVNIYGKDRDNMQPLQYMGNTLPIASEGSCYVCHKKKMDFPIHHENMDRPFRNKQILEN